MSGTMKDYLIRLIVNNTRALDRSFERRFKIEGYEKLFPEYQEAVDKLRETARWVRKQKMPTWAELGINEREKL